MPVAMGAKRHVKPSATDRASIASTSSLPHRYCEVKAPPPSLTMSPWTSQLQVCVHSCIYYYYHCYYFYVKQWVPADVYSQERIIDYVTNCAKSWCWPVANSESNMLRGKAALENAHLWTALFVGVNSASQLQP